MQRIKHNEVTNNKKYINAQLAIDPKNRQIERLIYDTPYFSQK
jgi:hypothetical protein